MPLTRHVYRSEEVTAALLWSIGRGRCKEAAFWALELEDSGYGATICEETLRLAWSLCCLLTYPSWILGSDTQSLSERAYRLAQACASGKRDATVSAILSMPATIDRVGTPALGPLADKYKEGTKELFLVRALLQGKVGLSWGVVQGFTCRSSLWDLFCSVASWKHGSLGEQILRAVASGSQTQELDASAVALLCAPAKTLYESPIKPLGADYIDTLATWTTLEGRRARRLYSISTDCLSWNSCRSQDVREELHHSLEEALKGAPWWETLQQDALEQAEGDVDEAIMLLYDTAFPDDIPDEWSTAERAKSHGPAYIRPEGSARFLKNLLGSSPSSLLLWNPTIRPGTTYTPPTEWNFTPVHHLTFVVV